MIKKTVLILSTFLVLSLLLNLYLTINYYKAIDYEHREIKRDQEINTHPFISHRLFYDHQNDIIINFIPLRRQIRDYIEKSPEKIGLYFEYLPTGNSIGINEKEPFFEASLIKVPTVMATYKLIETGKINPNDELTIRPEDLDNQFGSLYQKGPGAKVTVKEAIKLSLTQSDNTAHRLLRNNLPAGYLEGVFDYLDIPIEQESDFPIISPKNYTSILRSLHLASYLNKDYSNLVLETLTQNTNKELITKPLPNEIKVAHKDGVYENKKDGKAIYNDCGIVYVPKRPYTLCIMIEGSEEKAQNHIQQLSNLVYKFVNNVNALSLLKS